MSGVNLKDAGRSTTVASLDALNSVTRSLASAEHGEVYLVHMLLPHYPYVVGRDCEILSWENWKLRRKTGPLKERQRAYLEQLRCTTKKVSVAIDAFRKSNGGKGGIIILHGDHGSRITDVDPTAENLGRFGDAELLAGFSTLFAVQSPHIKPGYHGEPQPVAMLLKDLRASNFRGTPRTDPSRVGGIYLDDDLEWIPRRRVALPNSLSQPDKSGQTLSVKPLVM